MRTGGVAEINNKWLVAQDLKKVFAPVSKNANTSVKKAIQAASTDKEFVPKDAVISNYGDYDIVAITRNPFDRLVSCYNYFHTKQPQYHHQYEFPTIDSFEKFVYEVCDWPDEVSNKHFRSQFNLLSQDGIFLPNILIDFTNLEQVKEHFPIKNLGKQKVMDRPHYSTYYTDKLRKMVEKRFWVDFNYFNYGFEHA